MATLYEIADNLRSLLDECDRGLSPDGTIDQGLKVKLDESCKDLDQKLAGCLTVRTEAQSESDMLEREIERLQKRKKATDRKIEWLTEYMKSALQTVGETSMVVAGKWTLRIQKVASSVFIVDASKIPKEFEVTKTEISKSLIKQAIESGRTAPGCEMRAGDTLRTY